MPPYEFIFKGGFRLNQPRARLRNGASKIDARPLAWHDLLTIYRFRNEVQCLDTALALTRGNPVGPWAMLDSLRFEQGSYTCILRQGGGTPPLVGQLRYSNSERTAHLAFVMPQRGLDTPGLVALMENLAWEAGARGACSLLAEVDENSPAIEGLRKAGFSLYSWQRVWKLSPTNPPTPSPNLWENTGDLDSIPIHTLYQSLVPPLVQSAEPQTNHLDEGLVYADHGELLAYIAPIYGPHGIYLLPLVHPGVTDVALLLTSLVNAIPFQLGRPIYISVRSYQAWIENALAEMGAEVAQRQALMVKHLAIIQREPVFATRQAVLNKHQPAMLCPSGGDQPSSLVQQHLEATGEPVKDH